MMLSTSITRLLFLSLPLMALARRFPNGATDKVTTRQVWLTISVVFLREESLSEGTTGSPTKNGYADCKAVTSVANSVDARRNLEGVPRFVGGVGSRPPKCSGRCGTCSPCVAMNVPVGGAETYDEYYPEVWRCQCDHKLYTP